MAATDQNYRSQHTLDIVFAISSLVMLFSVVWMFADDYYRPWKVEQRDFREVESALAVRLALEQIPDPDEFKARMGAFDAARKEYQSEKKQSELSDLRREVGTLQPKFEYAEVKFQETKADLESRVSFYNIAMDHGDTELAKGYKDEIAKLETLLQSRAAERDGFLAQVKEKRSKIDAIEQPMTKAQVDWKKLTDKFDTQVKLAYTKQWGFGDWFRSLPVIDGFASPVKIQQITNNDIPIDYNFKQVTRFDRCATCHLGIDRPAYTEENLRALLEDNPKLQEKLDEAHKLLGERTEAFSGLPEGSKLPNKKQLQISKVRPTLLTNARIKEYAAHPRLDLFVGANSKHPMEKFGCSACHAGQGSATDFTLAAHTPDSAHDKERWVKDHGWEAQHMWDFPMLPHRFVESSCLKCHHQVTDLISSNNRVEAPKLLRGYNLIKENGCFGCHEIAGSKAGRAIGPDMRLEPYPSLDDLTPGERTKFEGDTENPPGTLRKVGPSLFRISEKTNLDWTAKWIRSPRGFRPDTKMPHFFGTSNNDPSVLPTEQKDFPDAEIRAIAHYLINASNGYVKDIAERHAADKRQPIGKSKDEERLIELLAKGKEKLNETEKTELDDIRWREKLRKEVVLEDLAPGYAGNKEKGRLLFTEKGCLACHTHEGTTVKQGDSSNKATYVPAVKSEAQFGPNLSQITAKLGGADTPARTWLIQWIVNPHVHSPRSRMPVTHLSPHEAADVAAWLLKEKATDLGDEWANLTVPEPEESKLGELAKVYLVRLLSKSDLKTLFETGELGKEIVDELPQEEQVFAKSFKSDKLGRLRHYVGKKAVGRLGCYACHDVPGFDAAKPIGTALNDWGKKPADRLAFEDINNFVKHHFFPVATPTDPDTKKPYPPKTEKHEGMDVKLMPYEKFYYDDLTHGGRTGYLHQKLLDPRSYDYGRIKTWDDRARMPQFRFARARKKDGETDADFEARAWREEAEAREAVMTFILGLVAEPVPTTVVNQPKGDRLLEVKGRQVLDKYNCGGCHVIRPGAYEFQVTPGSTAQLEKAYAIAKAGIVQNGYHSFPLHHNWSGKNPTSPDRLMAGGVKPRVVESEYDDSLFLQLTLAEALRFVGTDKKTKEKVLNDIPASTTVKLPLEAFIPNLKAMKVTTAEEAQVLVDRVLGGEAPFGGRFSDLMVGYLFKKDREAYKDPDSSQSRASLPPSLIGEGERTQSQWLLGFLKEPRPIRRMTILQMPKFNLSQKEAEALVDYFGAVERITNPGIGITPNDAIPQQVPLDDPYWITKNSEYMARLQTQGTTWLKERLAAYDGAFKQAAKLSGAALEADKGRATQQKEDITKQIAILDGEAKKAKDKADKDTLETKLGNLRVSVQNLDEQIGKLDDALKAMGPDAFKTKWMLNEGYVADGYRLLANKKACLQCHEVSGYKPTNPETQGPPLAMAHERLRPGWVYRWVALPQRFVTYTSLMPPYFPRIIGDQKAVFQEELLGDPLQQVEAVRDVLMNYPRVIALPINQQWNPNLQPPEKK